VLEPLYTAEEMHAAEEAYPGYPDTIRDLMQRAGRAVAEEAMRRFPDARRFEAVCGKGSNGGDGRVAVEMLRAEGHDADVVDEPGRADVVIDALFGTGFHGEPREEAARLIDAINAVEAPVVAVDIPSGVDASTGEAAGAAVKAELTVTMHGWKVGLAVAPGRFHAGEVSVADIGLDAAVTSARLVTEVGAKSAAFVPLINEDRVIAVISVATTDEPRVFSSEDLAAMQALASEATIALERTRSAIGVANGSSSDGYAAVFGRVDFGSDRM